MIKYRLRCQRGHEFETWFQSSAAYDKLAMRGQLTCAACGSDTVEKAMMAPSLARGLANPNPATSAAAGKVVSKTGPTDGGDSTPETEPQGLEPQDLRAALKALRQKVLTTSDNVGPRFAEEARRIHDDEAPARSIYGQATREEARELIEDGITFLPLPPAPEDAN